MIPLINTSEYITTLYLFRLPNINTSIAFTNEDSATTLETLITNNSDYYKQDLTAYRVGDEDFVLNINYNEIQKYNYCVLTLTQDTTYYYFFYITSYRAISVDRSSIRLSLDTVTTYYKDIKANGVKGMLNRAHLPPLLAVENYANIPVINPDIMYGEDTPLDNYVVTQSEVTTQEDNHRYILLKLKLDNNFREYSSEDIITPYSTQYIIDNFMTVSGILTNHAIQWPLYVDSGVSSEIQEGPYIMFRGAFTETPFVNPNQKTFAEEGDYEGRYDRNFLLLPANSTNNDDFYTYTSGMKIEGGYSAYTYLIIDQNVMSFSSFISMNAYLKDYIEEVYMLPPVYNKMINDTNVNNGYLGKVYFMCTVIDSSASGGILDKMLAGRSGGFEGMYLVKDGMFFKKVEDNQYNVLAYKINRKFLDLSGYLEEDTNRGVWEEPKLYLYPYRYNDIYFVDLVDVIIKYNDYDINYLLSDDINQRTLMLFAAHPDICQLVWGVVDDSPSSTGDFAYDKYFGQFTWNNLITPDTTTPLSLLENIYKFNYEDSQFITYNWSTSDFSQYRIYQKALVDASEESAKRNAILNTASTLISSNFLSPIIAGSIGDLGQKYPIAGLGIGQSLVASGLNIAKSWTTLADQQKQNALNEEALKLRPATIIGQVTKVADIYYKYDTDNPVISACYELSMPEENLEFTEHKFYEIGYNCPYMINTKDNEDLFEYVFDSRRYFNYVAFTTITLNSKDLAIPYIQDIENRLTQGVLFYHINNYYDFDTNLVNKQTKLYYKPMITGGDE